MRKLFFIIIGLFLLSQIGLAGFKTSQKAKAAGETPITNCTELQAIKDGDLGGSYLQTQNIDCSDIANLEPIGTHASPFTGSYDGGGYTISNLTINRPSTTYVGLLGSTNASTLRNIGLTGVNVTGADNTGGLVGETTATNIYNCYVTGNVTGTINVGGLVGRFYNAKTPGMNGCYSTGTVTGTQYTGGLVGNVNAGDIGNSYSTATLTLRQLLRVLLMSEGWLELLYTVMYLILTLWVMLQQQLIMLEAW